MPWNPTNPGLKSETWATHLASEDDKKTLPYARVVFYLQFSISPLRAFCRSSSETRPIL
jgi:hypothetical protein